ncbi:MAG TPA: hypothetical protein PLP34_01820 [Chitinophagaceae bacterium]|nr:hypothetical protein [Chitinophagaceae bacterium]
MKKNTFGLILSLALLLLLSASCATKKKYGCPNHISVSVMLNKLF